MSPRNCKVPVLEVHEPFFPRHRKGADGPRAMALARARAQNNPSKHASHFKCLSVRPSSRTRTCPRCVSVASRGTARFPSLQHAEMECLCGRFSSPREILEHLPATVPSAALDRPRDAGLTASIPPHRCFANNRTSSRMPWTAPPRCVSSKTRERRLLEVTNANHACFLTGGGRVIASLAIDHARSRHRRRERSSRGDHHAIAFADGVLVVGRLPLANGRARSPRRSVFGARTLAKIVPSLRDETPPRPGSVAPPDAAPRLTAFPPALRRLSRSTTSRRTSLRSSRRSSTRNITPPGTASSGVTLGRTSRTRRSTSFTSTSGRLPCFCSSPDKRGAAARALRRTGRAT
jgi:hypothetical protein